MSGSHDTHAHDTHAGPRGSHPLVPEIRDEAGDTPRWIPVLGIALFTVLALLVVARAAMPKAADDAPAAAAVAPPADSAAGGAPAPRAEGTVVAPQLGAGVQVKLAPSPEP